MILTTIPVRVVAMSSDDSVPDIEVEITNGKTVRVNLSPKEWAIIGAIVTVLSMTTGYVL